MFLNTLLQPYYPGMTSSFSLFGITITFVLLQHIVRQILVSLVHFRISLSDTLYTFLAIFSLTVTVGLAVVFGLLGYRGKFIITPKQAGLQSSYFLPISLDLLLFY